MLYLVPVLAHPLSCPPSLDMALLSMPPGALHAVFRFAFGFACPPGFPAGPPYRHPARHFLHLRYYEGSDSCRHHLAGRSPRLSRDTFPAFRLQPRHAPRHRFPRRHTSVPGEFRTSPRMSRLVATYRRIEFALLRTASSLPVALHPASQRRSYLRLRGLGFPRHRLPLCCHRAFTGALIPAKAGILFVHLIVFKSNQAYDLDSRRSLPSTPIGGGNDGTNIE